MIQRTRKPSSGKGCLGAVIFMIGLGVLLAGIGYLVGGEVTAHNTSTGGRDSINSALYWVGGVFGLVGIAGGVVMFLSRNSDTNV